MGDGAGSAGQSPEYALAFSCVRSGKEKSSINLLAPARKKRRRDRGLVVVLILVSALVLGYSFTETKQVGVRSEVQPAAHPRVQVVEVGEIGVYKRLNIERARAAQVHFLPAPEESCDELRVLVDRSHSLPRTTHPMTASRCGPTGFPRSAVARCYSGVRPSSA